MIGCRTEKVDYEIVQLIESPALGHALIRYRYTSKDAAAKTQTAELAGADLRVEDGRWRLVFDQNAFAN